jgi:Uma2 family endonuclease
MLTLTLCLPPRLSERRFLQICQANPELHLERTATGELIVMSPTGSETGLRNTQLTGQLWWWNEQQGLGEVFDSSTGFRLPNGADRSPDASWVAKDRWLALTPAQRRRFAPLCPDFVAELRSPSDDLASLQAKMREYVANGARLGWLIDTGMQRVEIYRPEQPVEVLERPETLSGEEVLPGFVLRLERIWGHRQ